MPLAPKFASRPSAGKLGGAPGKIESAVKEDLSLKDLADDLSGKLQPSSDIKQDIKQEAVSDIGAALQPKLSSASKASIAKPSISAAVSGLAQPGPSFGAPGLAARIPTVSAFPLSGRLRHAADDRDPDEEQDAESSDLEPEFSDDGSAGESAAANLWGEEFEDRGPGYLFDPQDAMIGNTRANDLYVRDAIANGASEDDMRAVMDDRSFWDKAAEWFMGAGRNAGIVNQAKWSAPDLEKTPLYDFTKIPVDALTAIDDGTYDYPHMTSNRMTGTQYRHYVDMGLGGRPIEEITPTETYNKRMEMMDYGFTPFTPDTESMWGMAAQNAFEMPSRIKGAVSNARTTFLPDYTIGYGGLSFSGKDFDRRSSPYFQEITRQEHMDPYIHVNGGEGMTPNVVEYAIPDGRGNVRYAHGALTGVEGPSFFVTFEDGQTVSVGSDEYSKWSQNKDGQLMIPEEYWAEHGQPISVDSEPDSMYLTFTDGQRIGIPSSDRSAIVDENGMLNLNPYLTSVAKAQGTLPEDLGSLNDMDFISSSVENGGGSPLRYAGVQYYPDLVLSDGTSMPYADAYRIFGDNTLWDDPENPYDDDISYGLMPLNLNAPRRLLAQQPLVDNPNSILPSINQDWLKGGSWYLNPIDWTTGSIMISLPDNLPFIGTASDATLSLRGVDPATYNPDTNSYGLIGGYYDEDGNLRYGITDKHGNVDEERSNRMRLWNAAGNLLVPFTEQIAGNVGSRPIEKGLYNLIGMGDMPADPTFRQYLGYKLRDRNGEGVEEIIGNPFEELTSYGPDMYTLPAYDSSGNVMTDITGREIRDYDTPNIQRLRNAFNLEDAANAYLGGWAVSALMDAIPFPYPSESMFPMAYRSIRNSMAGAGGVNAPAYVAPDQAEVAIPKVRYVDQFYKPDEDLRDELDEYIDERDGSLRR